MFCFYIFQLFSEILSAMSTLQVLFISLLIAVTANDGMVISCICNTVQFGVKYYDHDRKRRQKVR